MAKETTNSTPQNAAAAGLFGDMSLLRDIIMGPKVIEYDQRFADAHAQIDKNDAATQAHFDKLEREMNARFDRLEQLLLQNVEKLNQQMHDMSRNDKNALADMLIEVSKQLKS
jgi:hypothetical protein